MQPIGMGGNYSVSQLLTRVQSLFYRTKELHNISVKGEISGFSRYNESCYFSLKDADGLIKCACFDFKAALAKDRNQYYPKDGDEVIVQGSINLFKKYGDLQLRVTSIRLFGIGYLYAAFEKLKIKLQNEGLFDDSRKKAIPFFPKTIGVVTSKNELSSMIYAQHCRDAVPA